MPSIGAVMAIEMDRKISIMKEKIVNLEIDYETRMLLLHLLGLESKYSSSMFRRRKWKKEIDSFFKQFPNEGRKFQKMWEEI